MCEREALSPPAGGDLGQTWACPETGGGGAQGRRASVPRKREPSAAGQERLPVTGARGTRFFSKATCTVSTAVAWQGAVYIRVRGLSGPR